MKNKITIALSFALSLTFFSCRQDGEMPEPAEKPIPVEVELDVEGFAPFTRVSSDGISAGDIREFFLLVENPQDPNFTYTVKMDHSYSDWRAYDLGTTNRRTLFFKNGSDPVNIKAVCWSNGDYNNFFLNKADRWTRPYKILLDKDVSYTGGYILTNDPVYANTTIIPKESCPNGKLRLSFRHLFAKVKFFVQIPLTSDMRKYMIAESSPISNLKVEGIIGTAYNGRYLSWVAASNEINKQEGIVSEPINITRYKWTPYDVLTTEYLLMVIPQAVADGTFKVSFQFEGKTYNWTCNEKDFRFETNKEYEITLRITSTRSATAKLSDIIQEGDRQ